MVINASGFSRRDFPRVRAENPADRQQPLYADVVFRVLEYYSFSLSGSN